MKGMQTQMTSYSQTISSDSSITGLVRGSQFSVLDLGAGGATNLDSITGEPAINDILILKNVSAYTVTVRDLTLSTGNILLSPTSFSMLNEEYNLMLQYINHSTYGNIWMEIHRTPISVASDSITSTELANLSVGTAELQTAAVTTAKIAALAIDNSLLAANAVQTTNITDLNVTTAKINDLAVTTAKIAALAVDEAQIADGAVATAKIADGAVTVGKLDTSVATGIFTVPVVFTADYYGQVKVELPVDCSIIKVSASVTKNINITDDATIIFKDQSLASMGQTDLTGGATIGNSFTLSPTSNNTFLANETLTLETSKVTDGGEAIVSVHYLAT